MEDNKKNLKKSENQIVMSNINPMPGDLIANLLQDLKKSQDSVTQRAVQLTLDTDPIKTDSSFASVYRRRTNLVPPDLLKRIRDSEELIGGIILPLRANQASLFARPRPSRFDVGIAFNLKPEVLNKFSVEEQQRIKEDVFPKLREILFNCGRTEGVLDREKRNLGQFFREIIEDALTFGAFAVEVRKDPQGEFHSFKAVDAGTIYFTTPQKGDSQEAENIRHAAETVLKAVQGLEVDIPKFQKDGYTYAQVIDNVPRQVYTDDELLYWSLAPSTDINRSGYPVSPIERVLSAITTHINLTTHNKMYFLNGRAAKNIMVFQTENMEEGDINAVRQQMTAHINSASASWRMPVFGISEKEKITIQPLDAGQRDMEFQYLADLNKRILFAAYQMSPDEVAALSYLSRGTNSQSLSEADNEFKLVAARDSGLRPLLLNLEDFINSRLLSKINPEWAKIIQINIEGLDAKNPAAENTELTADSALYLNMNDIMERVEKEDVPLGGEFPMNAAYLQILEKYFTKGAILKAFSPKTHPNADKDPELQYYMNDPMWLQMQQMKMQQQQAQQQMQMQGQQQQQQEPSEAQELSNNEDLDSAIAQLGEVLNKSEQKLPTSRKELLKRHKTSKKRIMDSFEKESKNLMSVILGALDGKEDDDGHGH